LDALSALCGSDTVSKGASLKEIEKWFSTNSVEPRLTKQQLQVALDREAGNFVIRKLENGNYQFARGILLRYINIGEKFKMRRSSFLLPNIHQLRLRKHGFPLLHCGKCRGFYGM
jgi:hypothetical protein